MEYREWSNHQMNEELSTIYHVLRAQRRRLCILELVTLTNSKHRWATAETVVQARQLARRITAIEQDISVDQASGDAYHSVYTSLTQTHLPVLDDIEVIDYDSNRKTLHPGRNLLPVATIAVTTSPVVKVFFKDVEIPLVVGDIAIEKPDSIAD